MKWWDVMAKKDHVTIEIMVAKASWVQEISKSKRCVTHLNGQDSLQKLKSWENLMKERICNEVLLQQWNSACKAQCEWKAIKAQCYCLIRGG